MSLWTYFEVCSVLGVVPEGGDFEISLVETDSRRCQKNENSGTLFFALSNELDGHDFVASAVAQGALCVVVEREVDVDVRQIVVKDTFAAFWDLARAARARFGGKVIGVTGSCGKTTVKNFLKQGLPRAYGAEKSFNNHVGVPLTLCNLPQDKAYAVLEIGMNAPGEIAPLAKLAQLDVAVVTTVQPVHVERLGSVEGIRVEKLSIAKGLSEDGILVCPDWLEVKDSDWGGAILRFGEDAQVDGEMVTVEIGGEEIQYDLQEASAVRVLNSVIALTGAVALGADVAEVAARLGQVAIETGRGNVKVVHGITIVDESYNANPASVRAALESLKGRDVMGRRIAILGQMMELGEEENQYHEETAQEFSGIDEVVLVGRLWQSVAERNGYAYFENSDAIDIQEFVKGLREGDVVVVKGSRSVFWYQEFVRRLIEGLRV